MSTPHIRHTLDLIKRIIPPFKLHTDRTQPRSPSQWIMTGSSVNDGKQPRGKLDLSDRRDEIVTTSRQSKGWWLLIDWPHVVRNVDAKVVVLVSVKLGQPVHAQSHGMTLKWRNTRWKLTQFLMDFPLFVHSSVWAGESMLGLWRQWYNSGYPWLKWALNYKV